ncbi:MAG: hypothetical protein WD556_10645 [Actinomycetota bacterium]
MPKPGVRADEHPSRRIDLATLAALAVGLLVFLLAPFVANGFSFPLGPDAPVYLWWTRIAGFEGISAAGERPGVPALLLELAGSTGLPLTAVVAGLEVAAGTAIGVCAATLVRVRIRSRLTWALAGALTGVFTVHLVAGYLANLIFTIGFLTAAVCLAARTRRGAWAAAGVLGATGLAHPYFFLVGAVVLVVTAFLAWRDVRRAPADRDTATDDGDHDPGEPRRIATALLGAGALVGIGMLSTLWGPRPPDVETSRDGFLRRAGLGAELASAYRERFVDRWARYVQWASLPLAVLGVGRVRGFVARFLLAWSAVTVAGVLFALATGWFPPDRFVTFGFAIPILAALGAVRLPSLFRGRWRTVGYAAATGLTVAMVLGASFAWFRNEPYITEEEVRAVETAGRSLDAVDGPTILVYPVEDPTADAPTFLLARSWNVVLASLPPDRIRDAVPTTPGGRGREGAAVNEVIGELIEQRIDRVVGPNATAEDLQRRPQFTILLEPFLDTTAAQLIPQPGGEDGVAVIGGPHVTPTSAPRDPLARTSPAGIALGAVAVLAVLVVTGFGWAATALRSTFVRIATAPAFGAAALIAGGLVVDRIGIRLTGGVPLAVALLVGGGGYIAFLLQRRARAEASDEVDQ